MILSVEYPIITTNPDHAHLLSILGYNTFSKPWILNNYINLVSGFSQEDERPWINFYKFQNYIECPLIDVNIFDRNFINTNSFFQFVFESFKESYFIILNLDLFYLSSSPCFQKVHWPHQTLLFGLEDNTIYLGDFYKNQKYIHTTEPFQNVLNAFENMEKLEADYDNIFCRLTFFKKILLIKKTKLSVELDIYSIRTQLLDFLNAKNLMEKYVSPESGCFSNMEYGIAALERLQNYVTKCTDKLYIKPFHVLIDHSKLMWERLNCLLDCGIEINSFITAYGSLLECAKNLTPLVIKFNVRGTEKLKNMICKTLLYFIEEEKKIIKDVLFKMDESFPKGK